MSAIKVDLSPRNQLQYISSNFMKTIHTLPEYERRVIYLKL